MSIRALCSGRVGGVCSGSGIAESALSYLGLGIGGIYPSWGGMIESGQSYITHAWWMILFPGLALFFTLFMTNSLGNRIKVAFNPRLKK